MIKQSVEAPNNPLAENEATAVAKPVNRVGNRETQFDPNAPALPQSEPSQAGAIPEVNPDPNAYAPPPQAALPATAPIQTLSGDWQAPTASAGSAPLIASAAGGTMTPQGDAANSMRGYQSAEGGTFGGFAADKKDPAAWSKVANGDPATIAATIGGADPALSAVSAKEVAKMLNGSDTQQSGLAMLAKLTPAQQAEVQKAFLDPAGAYASDQAGYDPNRASQQGMYESAWKNLQSQIPQASTPLPAGRNAGNSTAADPAAQAAGLAAQGLPPLPGVGSLPSGVDPNAVAANPQGYQDWLKAGQAAGQLDAQGRPIEGITATPGKVGTTMVPPSTAPALPSAGPSAQPTASGMGNVAQSAVTPENALTNSMLARAPGADRFQIAQDQYKAAEEASAPQYEADLRQAMRKAAAGGALGSGMLQTSIGDIAQNRDIANRSNRTNLLSEALKGTIGDQFQDVGIAQQQQGFQKSQQEQAFGNEVTKTSLQEALKSGDFNRALQMLTAGSTNNPSDTALALSQIFGGQASSAGASLAALLGGLGQKNATATPTAAPASEQIPAGLMDWIKNYAGSLGQTVG